MTCRAIAIASVFAVLSAACSGGSMTAPSSTTVSTITAPPTAPSAPFTLNGRVTESLPTPRTGIGGATIRISAGANAGRTVIADGFGYYTIAAVESGSTINVSADGYMSALRTVNFET